MVPTMSPRRRLPATGAAAPTSPCGEPPDGADGATPTCGDDDDAGGADAAVGASMVAGDEMPTMAGVAAGVATPVVAIASSSGALLPVVPIALDGRRSPTASSSAVF